MVFRQMMRGTWHQQCGCRFWTPWKTRGGGGNQVLESHGGADFVNAVNVL